METPPLAPAPQEPKKTNTLLIAIIIAVMLFCCCCLAVALAWQYGDQVIQGLGL